MDAMSANGGGEDDNDDDDDWEDDDTPYPTPLDDSTMWPTWPQAYFQDEGYTVDLNDAGGFAADDVDPDSNGGVNFHHPPSVQSHCSSNPSNPGTSTSTIGLAPRTPGEEWEASTKPLRKRNENDDKDYGSTKKKGKKSPGRPRKDDDGNRGSDDESTKTPFDDRALRRKRRIRDGETGSVWSETLEAASEVKLVSRLDARTFSKLPLSVDRGKRESRVVGFASQAFHVHTDDDDLFPGYIAGNVVIPPRGIKDAEGVGLCSQVFNVGDCQPGSVEFALADPGGKDGEFDPRTAQRYLLSRGDMFQIPPGNVYRIENHSKTRKADLFWTIVKCTSRAEQDDSDEEDEDH
ncbi:hypothetical protein ACHAWF_014879 [Thalassiosira exigua]